MRILLASPFLPYPQVPHAGGKFVWWELEHLASRHDVALVTRVFPGQEALTTATSELVSHLHLLHDRPEAAPNTGSTFSQVMSYRRLARHVRRLSRTVDCDVLLVEFSELGMFLDPRYGPPSAIDCHDVIAKPGYRRWQQTSGPARALRLLAFQALTAAERRGVRKFDLAFVRSPEDARWAARWIGHPNTQVLPHPAGLGMESLDREGEVPGRILFVGAMGRPFNVDAALFFYREVFPMVRRNMPDAQFWVVGAEPPQRLRALATEDPSLKVTGFVEDLTDHYRRASIFVAPVLVGGGIIVKILDAMAAGVPVVTTPYGNEGIEAPLGEACLVADSPEGFAAHVVSLLFDSGLRLAIGANGKDYVTGRFGKERIFAGLEESLVALSARV